MKFTAAIFAVVAASASAFAPIVAPKASSSCLNANIVDTVANLQGPGVVWGAEGIAVGKEESELRYYDNFGSFIEAVKAAGLVDALSGPGPFTVFAPTDSAFAAYKGPLTAEVLMYHVVPSKIASGSINGPMATLQGNTLTYERKFRKTFVDDAIIGQISFGSTPFPSDVECDNGVVHTISVVLDPNYKQVGAEDGLGGVQ
jgi:uncharacterized surface protein with fasciclin (FAS1) repeats